MKFGISFTLTHLNQAGALVHVYQDGSIHMNHGGTEMGQGLFQKVAQVAAARFGVDVSQVKITATDTAKVPNTSATAASVGSRPERHGGEGRLRHDPRPDGRSSWPPSTRQRRRTVRFEDGRVLVGGASYSFAEVAARAYVGRVSLSATGFYTTPKVAVGPDQGRGPAVLLFRLWRGGDRSACSTR